MAQRCRASQGLTNMKTLLDEAKMVAQLCNRVQELPDLEEAYGHEDEDLPDEIALKL